jgi:hypothetical protein
MGKGVKVGFVLVFLALLYVARAPISQTLGRLRGQVQSTGNHLTGSTTVGIGQRTKRQVIQNTLKGAIAGYRGLYGETPNSLNDLVTAGLLQRTDLVDEWGRPLVVDSSSSGLVIRSLGADARPGTADDWLLSR